MRRRLLPYFGAVALVLLSSLAWADAPALPGEGFPGSRYEALWTKSPFAVASDETVQASPDYSLVGIAEFEGISYASLIDKQAQKHFLLSSDKPANGLTLVSVVRGHDPSGSNAVIQKNGQSITLKLESLPVPTAVPNPSPPPQIPMPGTVNAGNGANLPNAAPPPPPVTFRPRRIHIPPQPQSMSPPPASQQQQPFQTPTPGQQQMEMQRQQAPPPPQ